MFGIALCTPGTGKDAYLAPVALVVWGTPTQGTSTPLNTRDRGLGVPNTLVPNIVYCYALGSLHGTQVMWGILQRFRDPIYVIYSSEYQ